MKNVIFFLLITLTLRLEALKVVEVSTDHWELTLDDSEEDHKIQQHIDDFVALFPQEKDATHFLTQQTIRENLFEAKLNIEGKPIRGELPPLFWEKLAPLTFLRALYISNFDMDQLPINIGEFVELRILGLSSNGLSQTPDLSKLIFLKKLFLWNNKLSKVSGLSNLVALEKISLGRNQFTELPGLGALVHLKSLDLRHNQFAELPDLSGLIALQKLYLQNNPYLTSLPRTLLSLAPPPYGAGTKRLAIYLGDNFITSCDQGISLSEVRSFGWCVKHDFLDNITNEVDIENIGDALKTYNALPLHLNLAVLKTLKLPDAPKTTMTYQQLEVLWHQVIAKVDLKNMGPNYLSAEMFLDDLEGLKETYPLGKSIQDFSEKRRKIWANHEEKTLLSKLEEEVKSWIKDNSAALVKATFTVILKKIETHWRLRPGPNCEKNKIVFILQCMQSMDAADVIAPLTQFMNGTINCTHGHTAAFDTLANHFLAMKQMEGADLQGAVKCIVALLKEEAAIYAFNLPNEKDSVNYLDWYKYHLNPLFGFSNFLSKFYSQPWAKDPCRGFGNAVELYLAKISPLQIAKRIAQNSYFQNDPLTEEAAMQMLIDMGIVVKNEPDEMLMEN